MSTRIEAVGLSKRYRWSDRQRRYGDLGRRTERAEIWAVRDVSFDVTDGETVGIIGTNGSGKSTLLRLVAGLTRPTSGSLVVSGSLHGLLDLGATLNPLLSARENSVSDLMISGLTKRQALDRLDDIAEFAELEGQMHLPLRTYSQGMRLRLAFATATAIVPDILLIDELLAVGDGHFQEKCMRRVEQLHERGTTVVLTSHEIDHVTRLCDRAIWMVDGRAKEIGDAAVISGHYQGLLQSANMEGDGSDDETASGVVRLGVVQVAHPGGGPTSSINVGAPLEVVVDLEVIEALRDAIVEISVHPEGSASAVLEVNTEADEQRIRWEPGEHRITVQLDRVDLVGGNYSIHVGVYSTDWSTNWAYAWEAASFTVRGPDATGVMSPPRRWSVGAPPAGERP